jgi:hypothetical protein
MGADFNALSRCSRLWAMMGAPAFEKGHTIEVVK